MASSTTQRRGPGLSRPRRAAVLLATLLVVALGTGAVWWWSPAPPPPANATTISDAAAAGEAQATTSEPLPPELPARSEAATRTAVVGRAIDYGGGPLAGFRVVLQRMDPKPVPIAPLAMQLERTTQHGRYPPLRTETDDAGRFAFESLDAGNYRCHISDLERHAEEFALGTGEVRELTLHSPLVALTLTFSRRGEVVQDCLVEVNDGKEPRTLRSDKTGVTRLFAAPGRCELTVRLDRRMHHSPSRGPCISRHVLLVPDGVPALQWGCEIGGTELVLEVEDPHGQASRLHA
ncbi:MAG TPA: carboxypeptidase-like regulatory domain-containing protein [Planctomycetota bacterium]|nr:carboxypeptidase-like regulatory domain-containing protein [Planctomycetota bacterium]